MLIKHNGCNAQQHLGKSRANNDAGALCLFQTRKYPLHQYILGSYTAKIILGECEEFLRNIEALVLE